jgi:hypothetical protein
LDIKRQVGPDVIIVGGFSILLLKLGRSSKAKKKKKKINKTHKGKKNPKPGCPTSAFLVTQP